MGVSMVLIIIWKLKMRRAYSASLQLIINDGYNETDARVARLYNLIINVGYNETDACVARLYNLKINNGYNMFL